MKIPTSNQEIFKEALKNGVISFIICMVAVGLITWFLAPVPQDRIANTIVSGLGNGMSGFLSGFVGLTVFLKELNKKQNEEA